MREVSKRTIIAFLPGPEQKLVEYSKKTAVLVDESDDMIIDRQHTFKAGLVVALTATPLSQMKSNEEILLMQVHKMWLLDCGFRNSCLDDEIIYVDSLEEFMRENSDCCKLIYADENDESLHEQRLVAVDVNSSAVYGNMVIDNPLVVSEEQYMRGVDYKTAHPKGISLLLMKPCSSSRAYYQALGRVGRYGALCRRYVLSRLKGREFDSSDVDSRTT